MLAYCDRSGVIGFCNGKCPAGMLPIVRIASARKLREIVAACSRHAYDGVTFLVPGVPEADTDEDALKAMIRFREWVNKRQKRQKETA